MLLPLIPCGWRIGLVLPLAVLQIYVPGLLLLGAPVSCAFVVASSFWFEFLLEYKRLVRRGFIFVLSLLLIISIIAMAWSVDLHLAFVWISGALVFLFVYAASYRQARRDDRWLRRSCGLLLIASLMFCASVVVFRLVPIIKTGFLQTNIGTWFINSNTLLELFLDSRNNVLDPTKSGGFGFVNANIASSFLGMLAMAFFGLGRSFDAKPYTAFAFVMVCTVAFTGSKAGLMLALPMLGLVAVTRNGGKGMVKKMLFLASLAIVFSAFAAVLPSFETGMQFSKEIEATTGERALIWRFAGEEFLKNPIFGLGFGGWQSAFPPYARFVGISEGYPPHNTFIYLWSQAGLAAMLLGAWFVWAIFRATFSGIRSEDTQTRGLALAAGLGAFWLTAQGMGENMGLLGDTHEQIVFAVFLAWFANLAGSDRRKREQGHA